MSVPLDKKRNISIIGHGGAGKTTLSGALLFSAGATKKTGSIDDGTSLFDYEPEERKRKISISAAIHHYPWRDHTVNLIDTPGYSNFLSETRAALRVSGGAVVMLSAISGVKVQTEVVWGYADDYEVSRVAFVNKMDRERANFLRAVDDLEKVLGVKAVAVQLPVTEGPGFNSVVDLITMKLHRYPDGGHGKKVIEDLPADHDGDHSSR